MYIYIYIYILLSLSLSLYAYIYIYIYVCMYVCMYVCICVYIYIYIYNDTRELEWPCKRSQTRGSLRGSKQCSRHIYLSLSLVYIYIYIYICICPLSSHLTGGIRGGVGFAFSKRIVFPSGLLLEAPNGHPLELSKDVSLL